MAGPRLRDNVGEIHQFIQSNSNRLEHSHDLLCIYEGDLLRFIEEMFKEEMGPQSFKAVRPRIPPFNLLTKIVDKLSRIYQQGVQRTVIEGNDEDKALVDFYIEQFDMDSRWNQGNEFYNLDKYNLMQPFYDFNEGKPDLRAVPNDRFLPFSDNLMDPTKITHVILFMGRGLKKRKNATGRSEETGQVDIIWVYSNEEWIIIDGDGDLRLDLMIAEGNPEGINPFGALPFTFINSSQNFLIPPIDSDTKRMTVLIPALFADVNYAVKFQSFSQIFAFNVDKANWTLAPNAVHFVDASPGTDKEAKVETVKPQVDISEVVNLAVTELGIWLNTKGIKPGSVGQISAENMASGVSKIVDEMDTADLRQKQATVYSRKEEQFWDLVLNKMHPVWVSLGLVENTHIFSASASVQVSFAPQSPLVDRQSLVDTANKEIQSGLKSIKTSREQLNPDWTQERLEEEEQRIVTESTISIQSPLAEQEGSEEAQAEEETNQHTHQAEAGTIGPSNDLGDGTHSHDEGWSVAPFGAGHIHTNLETDEISGPPI